MPVLWLPRQGVAAGISCLALLLFLEGSIPTIRPPLNPPKTREQRTVSPRDSGGLPPSREIELLPMVENIDLRIAPGKAHGYRIDLRSGEFVTVTIEQDGLDVEVKLLDSLGGLHFAVDGLNGENGLEHLPILAEKTGGYQFEIHGSGSGTYRMTLEPIRQATLIDRKTASAAAAYWQARELSGHNELPEAEHLFRSALEAWRESGYKQGQADASFKLGKLLLRSHRPREAKQSLLLALPLHRAQGNRIQEAIDLNELGLACMDLGQTPEALDFFEQAIGVSAKHGIPKVEMDARFNRGKLNQDLGEYGHSFVDLERALTLANSLKSSKEQAQITNSLGRGHLLLGEIDAALNFHRKALEILKAKPEQEVLTATHVHFGDVFRNKGDYKRAIASYLRAIELSRRRQDLEALPSALNNLGLTYFHMGRLKEALDSFRKALSIYQSQQNQAQEPVVSSNIGWVLIELGRFEEAFAIYKTALAAAGEQGRRPTEAATYFGMAWGERKRGNLIASRSYLKKALEIIESLRTKADRKRLRLSFLAGRQNFYDLLVEILMEQHQREPAKGFDVQAFEASERARCRTLLDSLEEGLSLPSLSAREIQQRVLDRDTVLLEYFLGARKSFLWAVTSETVASFELPGRAMIEPLAREVHGLLAESNRLESRVQAARKAMELSRVLFGPVAPRLNGERLLVVAPPELQYISFAALPDPSSSPQSVNSTWLNPLLRKYEIIVEPSATVLARLRELHTGRRPAPGILAVVAAPVFSPGGARAGDPGKMPRENSLFLPLRFSHEEAMAIKKHASGRVLLALGRQANRRLVLQGSLRQFRNLHFSAHGAPVRSDPERSAIVLSGYDESGRAVETHLRAEEIARLDLPADLVVLSACSTGLGKEIRGEGLVGLTQAFFSAGATRVVASLWDVDDAATARLMGLFYQNLFEKRLSQAASLREAQLTMWRQSRWQPPTYWAGFVLQGEFRR